MDEVDAPYMTQKVNPNRRKDRFQNELQDKLKQRRKLGMTADLTSEESDIPEDNDIGPDDDDDDGFLQQYRLDSSKKSSNRPGSATRRSPYSMNQTEGMSLGDTLRPGGDRFMKKGGKSGMANSMPPLSSPKAPPKDHRDLYGQDMPSLSPKGSMNDTIRPSKSLYDDRGGFSPKGKQDKGKSSLPAAGSQSMSKADLLFGRKTPTNEQQLRESPVDRNWQQPTLRKASPVYDQDARASPDSLRGRTTPSLEPSLRPITETPSPRQRRQSGGITPKSTRESPRPLNLDTSDVPRPKPRNTTDIFGKTSKVEVNLSDDEEKEDKSRRFSRSPGNEPQSRFGGRKTPTGQSVPAGRKTPTQGMMQGRKTPTKDAQGRITPSKEMMGRRPSGRDLKGRTTPTSDFQGRKTPTSDLQGRKTPTKFSKQEDDTVKKEAKLKKEPSLLDFLTNDTGSSSKNKKENEAPRLLKSTSHDSIGDELEYGYQKSNLLKEQTHRQPQPRRRSIHKEEEREKSDPFAYVQRNDQIQADQSSVCAEIQSDPNMRLKEKTSGGVQRSKSGKKMTQGETNNEIIDMIADEQEDRRDEIKHIAPPKSASKKRDEKEIHKPKPRHSLPGTPSVHSLDESNLSDTKSIRDAIYAEWKKEKMQKTKEKLREEKKKKEEEEKKKEKMKKDKELENELSYKAWSEEKKSTFDKDKAKQKRKEEEKKAKEEAEKQAKLKEAEKNFKIWKESKDEEIEEEKKRKRQEERKKKEEEEFQKKERKQLAKTAVRGWNNKKEVEVQKKVKEEKTMKRTIINVDKKRKEQQEQEALQQYHKWLHDKEKQQKREKHKTFAIEDDRPAWSPANKTIPFGR